MIRAIKGHTILLYEPPETWVGEGIILPSQETMRDMLRGKDKTISVDEGVPDIYRFGRIVWSEIDIPKDSFVYFNKHDAEHFELDKKQYYRIDDRNALAYFLV